MPNDLRGILVKDALSTAWLTYDDIYNPETFDIHDFRNMYAIGGADLSKTGDLTCATLLMLDKKTEKRYMTQMYWIPEDTYHIRIRDEKLKYDKWLDKGLLPARVNDVLADYLAVM